MERLAVLCTTMGQSDFSLVERMNIRSDAIITNQADRYACQEQVFDGHCIRMVTTSTRGVGINRNLGLMEAENEILLFADDDVCYRDDYAQRVVQAFDELPQASVIVFEMDTIKHGKLKKSKKAATKRRHVWNLLRFGACAVAVRRKDILRENINFTQLFGGGARYSSGEDSLFLRDCVAEGLKVYTYDYCLGVTCLDNSTWFRGFNEKYFYDKGAWLAAAFPMCKRLLKWVFFIRFRNRTDIPGKTVLHLMQEGIRGYHSLRSYEEWTEKAFGDIKV